MMESIPCVVRHRYRVKLCWSLLALVPFVSMASTAVHDNHCRSTEHAIKWRTTAKNPPTTAVQRQRRLHDNNHTNDNNRKFLCTSQSLEDAKHDAFQFLRRHVMKFDQAKLGTLGLLDNATSSADGLDQGLMGPTIEYALKAKLQWKWADAVPQSLFYEYVLNYANLNEARSNWRPLLWKILEPILDDNMPSVTNNSTLNEVVHLVNAKLWNAFPGHQSIYFHAGQTPLIYDPMSVITFGYASCTGLAILLVNALRTVGVAARVVGTPAWNGCRDKGNHNWVEVFDYATERWIFFEPSANQTQVDDLTTQPCSKWFCDKSRFSGGAANATQVYAARLVFDDTNPLYCPMAWEWDCRDVPGENRTEYYQQVCSQC